MELNDLFEDVDSLVTSSQDGEAAYQLLIRALRFYARRSNAATMMIPLEKGADALHVQFEPAKGKTRGIDEGGSFGLTFSGLPRIEFRISTENRYPTYPEVLEYMLTRTGKAIFVHEHQHYLNWVEAGKPSDYKPDYDFRKVKTGDKAEKTKYYNNDDEFAAYMRSLSEPLLAALRDAKEKGVEHARSNNPAIHPDFRTFLKSHLHGAIEGDLNAFLKFAGRYRLGALKRLILLHRAASKVLDLDTKADSRPMVLKIISALVRAWKKL